MKGSVGAKALHQHVAEVIFSHRLKFSVEFHVFNDARSHGAKQTYRMVFFCKHASAHEGAV